MYEEYLPIGSVIQKKDGIRYMITGYYLILEDDKKRVWDYSAVKHPIGYSDNQKILGLNHDEIDKVILFGYKDLIQQDFVETLIDAKEDLIRRWKGDTE